MSAESLNTCTLSGNIGNDARGEVRGWWHGDHVVLSGGQP